jgi:hypothetical protein
MQNPKLVKQFLARLESDRLNIPLMEAEDLGRLKENISALLGGSARFDPSPTGTTTLIYHPSWGSGQTPIGWIASIELPEHMSIRVVAEKRQAA